ncbi:MAG: PqqD family peptide modification chaperone [Planctomycetes bacterium]|nr:PqqD family peptide modification chaperone [Planctomycetota bacterium]
MGGPARIRDPWGIDRLQTFASSFIESTRDYVFIRPEDGLLILRPNRVHFLNETAAAMLGALYDQRPVDAAAIVRRFAGEYGVSEDRIAVDLDGLLRSLSLILEGKACHAPAVRTTPFGSHPRAYPVLSEIALTYRCQNRCFFCYASSPDRGRTVPEMTPEEVRIILDRIVDQARVPTVSFTGGEPTLRSDLPDLIAHARRRGLRTNLITNGIRCADEAYVAALAGAGLHSAQVSVEAGEAGTHDAVVANPGAFERTMRGVANLKAAGIHTHTNTTINARNRHALAGLIDLLADLGQEYLSMNMVIRTGGAVGVPDIRYDEIAGVVLPLKERTEARGMRFVWYSPVPYCLFNPVAHGLGAQGCAAADGLLSIAPDGRVLPCSSFEQGIGDLLHESFATIWRRREARYWRRKEFLPPGCEGCEYVDLCCGACPLYWDERGGFDEIAPHLAATPAWRRLAWRVKRRLFGRARGVGVRGN